MASSDTLKHQPAGVYVHIPFCRKKCGYCDFFSITDHTLVDPFITALRREAAMMSSEQAFSFDSLYIGGGTPSVLGENQIIKIIEIVDDCLEFCIDNEITIEVNPESARPDWLKAVRKAGANRLSIGVQSFNDSALTFLGRIHSARQAMEAVEAARANGFDNISLDIIYGLPGQTIADLEADLNQALSLNPEHLSCYMLTVEPGTPLEKSLRKKDFSPLSESMMGEMFLTVADILTRHDYQHYEISNFARSADSRSRHNTKYWQRTPYVGLGPAAHSCSGVERYWNVKNVPDYVKRLADDQSPRLSGETLTVSQQMTEALYLGLRLAEGINLDDFNREFVVDCESLFASALTSYQADDMLEITGRQCRLSTRGMLFHEKIVADLDDII